MYCYSIEKENESTMVINSHEVTVFKKNKLTGLESTLELTAVS